MSSVAFSTFTTMQAGAILSITGFLNQNACTAAALWGGYKKVTT